MDYIDYTRVHIYTLVHKQKIVAVFTFFTVFLIGGRIITTRKPVLFLARNERTMYYPNRLVIPSILDVPRVDASMHGVCVCVWRDG